MQIYVQVHLKAKNLKRLLAKVAELAEVCRRRGLEAADNMVAYTDAKGHSKLDVELRASPEALLRPRNGADGAAWLLDRLVTNEKQD